MSANEYYVVQDEDQATVNHGGKTGKILTVVFSFIFPVFLVLCCWASGFRCPQWRFHRRRTRIPAATIYPSIATTISVDSASTAASNDANISSTTTSSSTSDADPTALRSMPSFVYRSGTHEDKLGCVVCLAECKDGERGRLLMGCGHVFHAECIDRWLLSHSTCPICRSTVEI